MFKLNDRNYIPATTNNNNDNNHIKAGSNRHFAERPYLRLKII